MNISLQKISVCVVTYNQERYIDDCLRSIVEQDLDYPLEIIVSDDCSTDRTPEIILDYARKYPGLVKPIIRRTNVGPFKNYMDTHNRALGEFVAHCDGDDIFLPGKLKAQAAYLSDHPECAVVYGGTEVFNDDGECWPHASAVSDVFPDGRFYLSDLLRLGSIGIHSSQMYRKAARKTTDISFVAMDYFYTLEFLQSGYGYYMPTAMTRYRYNSGAGTMTTSSAGQVRNKTLIAGYMRAYLALRPDMRRDVLIGAITFFLVDLRNRRRTALLFARLAAGAVTWFNPLDVYRNARAIQVFKTKFAGTQRS